MVKSRLTVLLCIFYSFIFPAVSNAGIQTVFQNSSLTIKAYLPEEWQKTLDQTKDKGITSLDSKNGAEIIITVDAGNTNKNGSMESLQKLYIEKYGKSFNLISENEIPSGNGVTSVMLLFEYRSHGKSVLQRTLLMKNRQAFLTLECRAPFAVFSSYTEVFNKAMTDIDITFNKEDAGSENPEINLPDENRAIETEAADNKAWNAAEKNFPSLTGVSRETRKVMKAELKKINELEKKGILERLE